MKGILLTCRSATYARNMKRVLELNRISANIVRPDIDLTRGSCAYAVNISQVFLPEAVELLEKNNVPPVRVILAEGNRYKELNV